MARRPHSHLSEPWPWWYFWRRSASAVRIPVKKYTLDEIGYEGYWFSAPQAVTEGFLNELQKIPDTDPDRARKSNVKAFEQIVEWNIDDAEGNPMPLFKEIGEYKAKVKFLVDLPVDVVLYIVNKTISLGNRLEEPTKSVS
jgi:hypothetical protein